MKKEDLLILKPKWKETGVSLQTFEKEISFAWQAYNSNPLLQKCTHESLLASVYNVANTGLSLNPILKHAVILPRWNAKEQHYEACLEPQYQGLISLALKSGTVKAIQANLVYEGDEIDMDYSQLRKIVKHIPYIITGKPKGEIRAVYSICVLTDGVELGEVMSWPEVEDIRDRSESYKAFKNGKIKACIWTTDLGEMARKTVIKRHLKYLSKDQIQLQQAIELDNQVNGFRPLATIDQVEYLTHLIEDEIRVEDKTLDMLRIKLKNLNFKDEANELIDHIFENYVQEDQNLGQRALGKKIDQLVERENT